MLFDYNHGSLYKEKDYHNEYKNIKSKRATKRPKYKYTFDYPMEIFVLVFRFVSKKKFNLGHHFIIYIAQGSKS